MSAATSSSGWGFDDVPIMEDVLLMRTRGEGRLALLPGPIHVSARRLATVRRDTPDAAQSCGCCGDCAVASAHSSSPAGIRHSSENRRGDP
ncbi:MAG: hypothetical protein R3C10_21550 [Pirellulales bacterium]